MKYLKKYNESRELYLEIKQYIKDLPIELVDYNYYGNISFFTTNKDELSHIIVNVFNKDHSTYIDVSKVKYILLSVVDYLKLNFKFTDINLVVDYDDDGEVGAIYYDLDEIDSCPYEVLALRLTFKK